MIPSQQPSTPDATAHQKTTLFCPSCDHESDIDGDWSVRTVDSYHVLACPICETTITNRLREVAPAIPSD